MPVAVYIFRCAFRISNFYSTYLFMGFLAPETVITSTYYIIITVITVVHLEAHI